MRDQIQNTPQKPENPLFSLLFNVIIPVVILQKLGKQLGDQGPIIALIIALAFPIIYGGWDYVKNKRRNYISLFGLINVALTGGLALLELEGFWFVIKEAIFPFILGIGVLATTYTARPFMKMFIWNKNFFNLDLIEERLAEKNSHSKFDKQMKTSTYFMASSFFISSLLNFLLATWIFTEIPKDLPELQRRTLLNDQIAQMTWQGYVVIALPLMIFMIFIMVQLFQSLKKMTDLEVNDLLIHK